MSDLIFKAGPRVVTTRDDLFTAFCLAHGKHKRIGFVPTMGALHEGHLSLVDASTRECGFTVVSIFVNPTQFGPQEDYSKYPRTLEKDVALLASRGVDLVFAPTKEEIYRPGHATSVHVGGIVDVLEGPIRPGHFDGVATVVFKLFTLAPAHVAFFGRKDYQQSLVIRRMVADLDLPIEVRVCPTIRDADGLALSSRNAYLSADERKCALSLSQSLRLAQRLVAEGETKATAIQQAMLDHLAASQIEVQYVSLAHPDTLASVEIVTPGTVALIAAKVGATRLIDNEIL